MTTQDDGLFICRRTGNGAGQYNYEEIAPYVPVTDKAQPAAKVVDLEGLKREVGTNILNAHGIVSQISVDSAIEYLHQTGRLATADAVPQGSVIYSGNPSNLYLCRRYSDDQYKPLCEASIISQDVLQQVADALDETNSLFAAMAHETRPWEEIQEQIIENRTAHTAIEPFLKGGV